MLFVAVAALLAWGGAELCDGNQQKWPMAVVVFVSMAAGSAMLCVDLDSHEKMVNIKTLATAYMVISLLMNAIYSFFDFSLAAFLVPNGLLLLITLIIAHAVSQADV